MRKLSTLSLALLLTLPWAAGCHSGDQGPSSEQTKTASGAGLNTSGNTGNQFDRPRQVPIGPIGPIGPINPGGPDAPPTRTTDVSTLDVDHPTPDMILVTVHFGYDQFNIEREDRAALEAAAKTLAANPAMHVVAVGHTDHFGSEQYNLALSDRRSTSVTGYLKNNGAGAAQSDVLARGKFGSVPDAKKDSPEAKNDRRVDVIKVPAGAILPSGPPSATDATTMPAVTVTPAANPGS